jgi:hypothetical protein
MRIPRSTVDIVVVILATIVGLSLLVMTVGLIVGKIINPALDVSHLSAQIGNMMQTILGALVGFVGGRAIGKSEAK